MVGVVKGGSVWGAPVLVCGRLVRRLRCPDIASSDVCTDHQLFQQILVWVFVCFLRSHLRQLQVLNGGKGRQQLQPLRDPPSPSCEGAVARATPRTGPRPHPKSSLSSKKRVEKCWGQRTLLFLLTKLTSRQKPICRVPWSREVHSLLHLCGDPEKSRKGGITYTVWSPKGGLSCGSG